MNTQRTVLGGDEQALIFKALGDAMRLRILAMLPPSPSCEKMKNVCQLVEVLGGSQPNMSRHLKILKQAGLVRCQKTCSNAYYWRVPESFEELREGLSCLADRERGTGH